MFYCFTKLFLWQKTVTKRIMEMLKICLITGEESGDIIASNTLAALQKQVPDGVEAFGVGGARLQALSFESLAVMEIFSVVGIVNILKDIRMFRREIKRLAHAIKERNPDLLMTVDSPGLSYFLVKELRKLGLSCPMVHCVVPSIWAWRYERIYKFKRYFDHMFALFPFEVPYVEEAGMPCTYVGHPFLEKDWSCYTKEGFRIKNNMSETIPMIAVFPGSRFSEVDRLLPIFYDALRLIKEKKGDLVAVIPTLPHTHDKIDAYFKKKGDISYFCVGRDDKYEAVKACDVALAASGTVSLELAFLGLPMVISYKVSWLNKILASILLQTRWVCLVNILAREEIVPERLQEEAQADLLARDCLALMGEVGQKQKDKVAHLLQEMRTFQGDQNEPLMDKGVGDGFCHRPDETLKKENFLSSPGERSASVLLSFLKEKKAG